MTREEFNNLFDETLKVSKTKHLKTKDGRSVTSIEGLDEKIFVGNEAILRWCFCLQCQRDLKSISL